MEVSLGLILFLYILGLALMLAEIFIPGGITGAIGFLLVLASIYLAFSQRGPATGMAMILASAVAIPTIFLTVMKKLTHRDEMTAEAGYTASEKGLDELLGKRGRAVTPLRPAGIVRIEGRRVDVVSFSPMIEAETEVEVVQVEGNRVVVKPVAGGGTA